MNMNTKKGRIKHDQNINCTNYIHEKQNTNYNTNYTNTKKTKEITKRNKE